VTTRGGTGQWWAVYIGRAGLGVLPGCVAIQLQGFANPGTARGVIEDHCAKVRSAGAQTPSLVGIHKIAQARLQYIDESRVGKGEGRIRRYRVGKGEEGIRRHRIGNDVCVLNQVNIRFRGYVRGDVDHSARSGVTTPHQKHY